MLLFCLLSSALAVWGRETAGVEVVVLARAREPKTESFPRCSEPALELPRSSDKRLGLAADPAVPGLDPPAVLCGLWLG